MELVRVLLAAWFIWYIALPVVVAALVLPWAMNCLNGFGYWYNALTLIAGATGLGKRLERHRWEKHHQERMEWEAKQYWKER
jgi:hypothetical protein